MKTSLFSKTAAILVLVMFIAVFAPMAGAQTPTYPIADTGQTTCYNANSGTSCPSEGSGFFGQDAQYDGFQPSYTDNADGTVTDNVTGLMWQQDPGEKTTFAEAVAGASSFNLAGYSDWRLPTIKELYSLILFSGLDPSGLQGDDTSGLTPFIDTRYFNFEYGDPDAGERIIDSQWATSTEYVNTTMNGTATMFGVNFADGRIKGYPRDNKTYFVIYVRGNTSYGVNHFTDNGDGTVTDTATGLMWMRTDSGHLNAGTAGDGKLSWEQALSWAEDLEYAGHSDWRLPNVKELQGIVDYTRSPATTGSAAIDPIFDVTPITDEGGGVNYPFYWSGTTHANLMAGGNASYVAFGEALGWMRGPTGDYTLMDVHGAGAQRSDPKTGDPDNYPYGHGPQGDVIRIYNFARCVRHAETTVNKTGSLTVVIEPSDAVTAGAMWQVDQGAWQNSGATVTNLTVGTHTVGFGGAEGWNVPADFSTTIVENQTVTVTGAYTRTILETGGIRVVIQPGDAIVAGAKWRVDGDSTWRDAGSVVTLSVGSYAIVFNTIDGWVSPASQTVAITGSQIATVSGTYQQSDDPADADGDGDGYSENQGDCDDTDADIHPDASDTCGDGIDQNCDGSDASCETVSDDGGGGGGGCFINAIMG